MVKNQHLSLPPSPSGPRGSLFPKQEGSPAWPLLPGPPSSSPPGQGFQVSGGRRTSPLRGEGALHASPGHCQQDPFPRDQRNSSHHRFGVTRPGHTWPCRSRAVQPQARCFTPLSVPFLLCTAGPRRLQEGLAGTQQVLNTHLFRLCY